MKNLLSAAWTLSVYQIWNRKRRWVTLALFLLPVIIVAAGAAFRKQGGEGFYLGFVPEVMGAVLLPFVAIYWGSGALSDEIEGKTLVYLWTRPRDRGFLIFLKMAGCWVWIFLLAALGILSAYVYAYSNPESGGLVDNLMMTVWDLRALTLAGIAWACLSFLLSVLTKRPLTYGLLIAYLWELIPANGPGFLRRLSITQQMLALSTHKPDDAGMVKRLVEQIKVSEGDAILTLIGVAGLCAAAGIWLANEKEFLSDDPARNQ